MTDFKNKKIEFALRRLIKAIFRGSSMPTFGEGGHLCWFRPSEYPSLLIGIRRFEPDIRHEWGRMLRPHEVIFDIGANIGVTVQRFDALLAAQCTIWAFEPLPRNLNVLRRNCRPLKSSVIIIDSAVGDHNGKVAFVDNVNHGALSRLAVLDETKPHEYRFWQSTCELQVRQITLDSFVQEHPNVRPTFLKIDVEGAAGRVLKGAKETLELCKPVVSCSFHSEKERMEIVESLEYARYRGVQIHEDGNCSWQEVRKSPGCFLHPDDPRVPSLTFRI